MRWNLSIAALAASWGFISIIVDSVELSAPVLVFWRLVVSSVTVALVVAAWRGLDALRLPGLRGQTALLGGMLALHWFLFFQTIKLSSVAVALLTVYTAPIFLALLAPVFLPEARSRIALAALVPAAIGLVLIALTGHGEARLEPLALAFGIGAGISYALLVIGVKHLAARLPAIGVQFWTSIAAALVLAPFLVAADRVVPRGLEIPYLVLIGAVFTALSQLLYIWLLRRVTAQAIGILAYIEVVSAAVLAWALLGQELTWPVLAGGALIVAAGLLVVFKEPVEPPVTLH